MIFHTLVIDVNTGTCTCSSRSSVDIPQGDKNSHQLLLKLVHGDKFYSIEEGCTPEITFYDSFDHELFTSLSPKIANAYRGYVTYVVGPRLVRDFGRYVGRLDLYDRHHDRKISARFIVNVIKTSYEDGCGCGCDGGSTEVVVTREFYNDLLKHLRDDQRHLTDEDRDLLDWVAQNKSTILTFDNLGQALSEDPEVREILEQTVKEVVKETVDDFQDISDLRDEVDQVQENLTWNSLG